MTRKPTPAEAAATVRRLRNDPAFFAREVLGVELCSYQRAIAESVRDHPRTAVRSSHGVGKTSTAAVVALQFLATRRPSRVITTAPTWYQVESLLWSEIGTKVRNARVDLGMKPNATSIKLAEDWFAIGLSTNEPERFQGHHSPAILVIFDEASGVDDSIFEAAEGYFTAAGNEGAIARMLAIGNPTRVTGQFAKAFGVERELWNTLHVSAFDSPACSLAPEYDAAGQIVGIRKKTADEIEPVSDHLKAVLTGDAWIEDKVAKWGLDSPIFAVRVLGNFPSQAENSVVSVAGVEDAVARSVEPAMTDERVLGVDVARFGDDETVIFYRHGRRLRMLEAFVGQRTTYTAGRVIALRKELEETDEAGNVYRPRVVVDDAGVGGGVTDVLVEAGVDVVAFNGGSSAMESDEYPNARSEAWFRFRDELPTLDLEDDDRLIADLTAPTYTIDKHGRRVVEPKDTTKKRLKRSPDRADAALLSLVPDGFGADLDFI